MVYVPPNPQQRYADSGRREIRLLNRVVPASLVALKESDAKSLAATHELFVDKIPGINPQQVQGQTVDFDGAILKITKVTDPRAADPTMRGRYWRLICVLQT